MTSPEWNTARQSILEALAASGKSQRQFAKDIDMTFSQFNRYLAGVTEPGYGTGCKLISESKTI